jgi:hypothetical protein
VGYLLRPHSNVHLDPGDESDQLACLSNSHANMPFRQIAGCGQSPDDLARAEGARSRRKPQCVHRSQLTKAEIPSNTGTGTLRRRPRRSSPITGCGPPCTGFSVSGNLSGGSHPERRSTRGRVRIADLFIVLDVDLTPHETRRQSPRLLLDLRWRLRSIYRPLVEAGR